LELPNKQSLSRFYKYAAFTVFAVVIGQSFLISTSILIPFSNLTTYDGFENAFMLILAYFFIISSWIGYFISITKHPHNTKTKLGTARFATDLFILYLFYYLVSLIPNNKYHSDIFVWAFPIIFGTFLFWDILKYLEYRKDTKKEKEDRRNRLVITAIFLAVFLVQAYIYVQMISMSASLKYDGNVVWNTVFTVTSFISVAVYRFRKAKYMKKGKKGTKKT
jgi:hypothetical protein